MLEQGKLLTGTITHLQVIADDMMMIMMKATYDYSEVFDIGYNDK